MPGFMEIGQGVLELQDPSNTISYTQRSLSLQQCQHYRAAL